MENIIYKCRYLIKKIIILLIKLMVVFPIKTNKVFLFSYFGKEYSCNPKYITEYILENYQNNEFKIVWAFKNIKDRNNINGIKIVKINSIRYFFELMTSKVIITNCRTNDFFIKRKNQYYIQTWHSSLRLKKIEKDAEDTLGYGYINTAKKDSKKCDLLISGSKKGKEILKKSFWYSGEIMECGTPRNDIFFKHNNLMNISSRKKVILYAPTFRKNENLNIYNLNYKNLLEKIRNIFNEEFILMLKFHPNISEKINLNNICDEKNIVNATNLDIQEIMLNTDILITDYSSLMFDFMLTKRPCFLYTPDLDEYIKSDRGLYFNIEKLPFKLAKNNNDLINLIEKFNLELYKREVDKFLLEIGNFEEGNATEKVVNRIAEICNIREK